MNVVNKNSGFTLLEFVVYTAIFSFVILALFQFLVGILDSQSRGNARDVVISNTLNVINTIDHEIRHAEGIYTPTSEFDSAQGQLSLATRKDSPSGESEVYVDMYTDSDGRFCIKKEGTGVRCLTTDDVVVTRSEFTQVLRGGEPEGIRTSIEVEYSTSDASKKESFELNSFTKPRNY